MSKPKTRARITVRQWNEEDIPAIVKVHAAVYGHLYKDEELYDKRQYTMQYRAFPEGQFLAEIDGEVVGYATSLILQLDDEQMYRYPELSGGGTFSTHNPEGDTLYGADIGVHPDYRRTGIAGKLYVTRKKLLRKYNLRRMVAYGRIPGYAEYAGTLTPNEYVKKVEEGELQDPALNAHLKSGYRVKKVLFDLMNDEDSMGHCTFLEYPNPTYKPKRRKIAALPLGKPVRKIRVCAAQYLMRPVKCWEDLENTVEFFVNTADTYSCHFLVLPEYFTVQLFSLMPRDWTPLQTMVELAGMAERYIEMFQRLAQENQLYIIGGSHPILRDDGHLYNVAHFFTPSGQVYTQDKLHITPYEREHWNIRPGQGLKVFDTPFARIAIQICYDIEFPEVTRLLTLAGAEAIFVPFSTDEKKAYFRVRYTAQARAVENYIYTVISGNAGNLPTKSYLINYAQSAVLTPSDVAFPSYAIAGEADPNTETVVIAELDLSSLAQQRELGNVRPLIDRRTDLYEVRAKVPVRVIKVE